MLAGIVDVAGTYEYQKLTSPSAQETKILKVRLSNTRLQAQA